MGVNYISKVVNRGEYVVFRVFRLKTIRNTKVGRKGDYKLKTHKRSNTGGRERPK